MPENSKGDGIVEIQCTKEHPWDHKPFDPKKTHIIHNGVKEIWESWDGHFITYKCSDCGHEFTIEFGD